MKIQIVFIGIISLFISCNKRQNLEKFLLLADREVPLGWVYLRMNKDKTFEYEARGLSRKGDIYSGTFEIKNDTIYFNYSNSIPVVGDKAVLSKKFVSYYNGKYYVDKLEIKHTKIKHQSLRTE